jgi:hypothetical protein
MSDIGYVPFVCDMAYVASLKPSIWGKRIFRCGVIVEVSLEYIGSPHPKFPIFAMRNFVSVLIDKFGFHIWAKFANRADMRSPMFPFLGMSGR